MMTLVVLTILQVGAESHQKYDPYLHGDTSHKPNRYYGGGDSDKRKAREIRFAEFTPSTTHKTTLKQADQ